MPSAEFNNLLSRAKSEVLDHVGLSESEKDFIEREAVNLLEEWFNTRRKREWREAEMPGESLAALFAVMTHCFNAAAEKGSQCRM